MRVPLALALALLALTAAGCLGNIGRGPTTSVLAAVYEAPPDVVRAEAVAALGRRGLQVAGGGRSGPVVAFAPTAPDARLTLTFAPYGRHTHVDAHYVYPGAPPASLPYEFHLDFAEALLDARRARSALLPVATYPEGEPPCFASGLTPDSVFARPFEPDADVNEGVERMPELIGGLAAIRPAYPEGARRRGFEGRVIAQFIVQPDGSVSCIEAVSGPMELAPAALAAIAGVRFTPGIQRGEPARVRFSLPVNFRLL